MRPLHIAMLFIDPQTPNVPERMELNLSFRPHFQRRDRVEVSRVNVHSNLEYE